MDKALDVEKHTVDKRVIDVKKAIPHSQYEVIQIHILGALVPDTVNRRQRIERRRYLWVESQQI